MIVKKKKKVVNHPQLIPEMGFDPNCPFIEVLQLKLESQSWTKRNSVVHENFERITHVHNKYKLYI